MNLTTFYKGFLLLSLLYIVFSFLLIYRKERKKGKKFVDLFINFKNNFAQEIKGIVENPIKSVLIFFTFLVVFYFAFTFFDYVIGELFICSYSVNLQQAQKFYFYDYKKINVKNLSYYLDLKDNQSYNYYRKVIPSYPSFINLSCFFTIQKLKQTFKKTKSEENTRRNGK